MSIRLSILIPVFNWDISLLLTKLYTEIRASEFATAIEIIIIDDYSGNMDTKLQNRTTVLQYTNERLNYIELEKNIGRAAIRNVLVEKAKGEYLLFLDVDVLPDDGDFLSKYWNFLSQDKYSIVCGGISYKNRIIYGQEFDFYIYLFGTKGFKSAKQRNENPWRQLLTSNVMVKKNVLMMVPFDERFTGYGYEDNEWGIRLMHQQKILHIDNTVSHLGIQSKAEAYKKMRESIAGYLLLADIHPEVFQATRIAVILKYLSKVNLETLERIDRFIQKTFFRINVNWILYLLFQFNKVILLAVQQKSHCKDVR